MSRTDPEPEAAPAAAVADFELSWPPATWDMELRRPVEDGDQVVTSLSLREPTMAEYEEIMATPAAVRIRKTVSIISALPMGVVARIGVGDVVRAEAYCSSFFDIGQVIGVS